MVPPLVVWRVRLAACSASGHWVMVDGVVEGKVEADTQVPKAADSLGRLLGRGFRSVNSAWSRCG